MKALDNKIKERKKEYHIDDQKKREKDAKEGKFVPPNWLEEAKARHERMVEKIKQIKEQNYRERQELDAGTWTHKP